MWNVSKRQQLAHRAENMYLFELYDLIFQTDKIYDCLRANRSVNKSDPVNSM